MTKKFPTLFVLLMICVSSMAQLSQKEKTYLINTVKENYNLTEIDGSSLYKTKSGYRVLVTVVSLSSSLYGIEEQNREAQIRATRLASEFLNGATNQSITIYDSNNSSNSSKELISDKITQSSKSQLQYMQPLFRMKNSNGQNVFAYFLVISKPAAKNGVAGVLSIVPGMGQYYKGSVGKGTMFLGLSAAAVAGIIVCEETRSAYVNKAIEQPKFKKEYTTRANNWETGRNVSIGVGGAIWLWNIIDAFAVKKSMKQKAFNNNYDGGLSVQPFAIPNAFRQCIDLGIGLTYNF